jgi:polyisoprenoid-binding protein YceI
MTPIATYRSSNRRIGLRTALAAVASVALLAACAGSPQMSASRAWGIDTQASSLTFVTTKAGAAGVGGITETARFKRYEGGMDAGGKISLSIDLASVDSGIEIRDERLRTMLWNVKATPIANFTAQLPAAALQTLGTSGQTVEVEGQLSMAGQTKPVAASLSVTQLGQGKLLVSTRAPIVVNANDFGLKDGVEALRAAVGLNFLASSAPVQVSLLLNAQ